MKHNKIKNILVIFLILLLSLSFTSCKKDVVVNGDDKETHVWSIVETHFYAVAKTAGEISDLYNIWDYEGRIEHDMYYRGLYGEYYVFDAGDVSSTTLLSTSECKAVVSTLDFFFPEITEVMSPEEFYDYTKPPAPLNFTENTQDDIYYYYIETFYGNITVYVNEDGDFSPDDLVYVTR